MLCTDNSKLIPQTEEGITDVKWINRNETAPMKKNTYSSILEVLNEIDN
jgi:hypothetical protein